MIYKLRMFMKDHILINMSKHIEWIFTEFKFWSKWGLLTFVIRMTILHTNYKSGYFKNRKFRECQ